MMLTVPKEFNKLQKFLLPHLLSLPIPIEFMDHVNQNHIGKHLHLVFTLFAIITNKAIHKDQIKSLESFVDNSFGVL